MTLTLELPNEQAEHLQAKAESHGLGLPEYARQLILAACNGSQQPQGNPRIPGLHAGSIWIADDFDEPLPDSFWPGE